MKKLSQLIILAMAALLIVAIPLACAPAKPTPAVTPKPAATPAPAAKPAPAATPAAPAAPAPIAKKAQVNLKVFVSGPGTGSHTQAVAMAALLEKYSDWVRMTVVPGVDTGVATAYLQQGKGEWTRTSGVLGPDVVSGTGEWKDRGPFAGLRILWNQAPIVTYNVVLAESPIKSISDFKGKKIGTQTATATAAWTTFKMLEMLGVTDLRRGTHDFAIGALKDGTIDAISFVAACPFGQLTELAMVKSIRLLPVPDDTLKKVQDSYKPGIVNRFVIKAGTYKGQTEDIASMENSVTWITRADIPTDVVYEVTKVFFDHFDEAVKIAAAARDVQDPVYALAPRWAPFHPGAERYFKAKGWLK